VVRAVEVIGGDAVADLVPRLGIEKQATKNGLLSFDGMWWRAECVHETGILAHLMGSCHGATRG
jgi:hypothetical protein